jgi:hypothetical protein
MLDGKDFKAALDKAGLDLVSSHATRMLSKSELASGNLNSALEWWDECI